MAGRHLAGPIGVLALASMHAVSLGAQPRAEHQRAAERAQMVHLIERNGVGDSATLAAMRSVPRHEFVPANLRRRAYGDHPLPIGLGQTISQPFIVAYMTEILRPKPGMKVLEVGTGSGYQAAVLSAVGCDVYSVEIITQLQAPAQERLTRLGFDRVRARHGDGHFGWPEEAPFDAIIVTAAAGFIPPALVDQLKPGGRMVIPVGNAYAVQNLILLTKDSNANVRTRMLLPVRFVPMTSRSR